MKAFVFALLSGLLVVMLAACATPLNSMQKAELRGYQAKGIEVQEKNPTTGAVLGLLPGFGSFYAREPGFGIANLLLWPLSILWDPVSGYEGSQSVNYYATKASLHKMMRKDIAKIEHDLSAGTLSKDNYLKMKSAIELKYSPDLE